MAGNVLVLCLVIAAIPAFVMGHWGWSIGLLVAALACAILSFLWAPYD